MKESSSLGTAVHKLCESYLHNIPLSYNNEKAVEVFNRLRFILNSNVNNIIGLPGETYDLAFETIELNRNIPADDRNAYPFTPFHGIPLRDECDRLGYTKYEDIVESLVASGSMLDMPQFPKEKIQIKKVLATPPNFPAELVGVVKASLNPALLENIDTSEGVSGFLKPSRVKATGFRKLIFGKFIRESFTYDVSGAKEQEIKLSPSLLIKPKGSQGSEL